MQSNTETAVNTRPATLEEIIEGWVEGGEHRERALAEVKRLRAVHNDPIGFWWNARVKPAIVRRLPFWLYRFLLKVQLFLHAVANPRGERI